MRTAAGPELLASPGSGGENPGVTASTTSSYCPCRNCRRVSPDADFGPISLKTVSQEARRADFRGPYDMGPAGPGKRRSTPLRASRGCYRWPFTSYAAVRTFLRCCTSPPASIAQREARRIPAQVRCSLRTRSAPRQSSELGFRYRLIRLSSTVVPL